MSSLGVLEPAGLPQCYPPLVLPVPGGAVKVLPRWADEDQVQKWRLRYRLGSIGSPETETDGEEEWIELELHAFTRELPLTGLVCEEPHEFTVAIQTPAGWSDWSPAVSCVPPEPQLPGKSAAVFAVVKDDTTALVRWTRPIDTAAALPGITTRYRLLVTWTPRDGEHEGSCQREIFVDEDIDECEVEGLECLCEYRFQVSAFNSTGWGDYSDQSPVLMMPPPVPPVLPPPTLRRATHHSVVIQWQHPPISDVVVESFAFRYTTTGEWKKAQEITDVPASLSQFVVQGLRPGETHIFQVRAINKYGMGIWSDGSIPIRTPDGHEPSKTEGVTVPNVYRSFITLQWPPASNNGFEVERHLLRYAHKPDMVDAVVVEPQPQVVHKDGLDRCDLRHLKKTEYYFQVAAINKMGQSEWSDPVKVDLTV